jgi:hypothetical protein
MNIFVLSRDPHVAAREMCDKHVVKMIIESAQMLSTCHRMLDGVPEKRSSVSGKRQITYYKLDDWRESHLYKAVHYKHPCNIWLRENISNYFWLYNHFLGLLSEYRFRYNKQHACERLINPLAATPNNIPNGKLTEFAQAMPEECKSADVVASYRNYYNKYKQTFATWKGRDTPPWFKGVDLLTG